MESEPPSSSCCHVCRSEWTWPRASSVHFQPGQVFNLQIMPSVSVPGQVWRGPISHRAFLGILDVHVPTHNHLCHEAHILSSWAHPNTMKDHVLPSWGHLGVMEAHTPTSLGLAGLSGKLNALDIYPADPRRARTLLFLKPLIGGHKVLLPHSAHIT